MAELYFLRQEAKVHEKGIRSLCVLQSDQNIVTAGYDGLVIVWARKSTSETSSNVGYEPEHLFSDHTGVVYSVCDGGDDPHGISTFFSGGQDKKIFWVTSEGKSLRTFNVNNGG